MSFALASRMLALVEAVKSRAIICLAVDITSSQVAMLTLLMPDLKTDTGTVL